MVRSFIYCFFLFNNENINRSKGNLRSFPMNIDGPIKTFAEFNNENCRNGFLYFNQRDDLRISVMPSKRVLDTHWPLQRIPMKQTGKLDEMSSFVKSKIFRFSTFSLLSCRKQSKQISRKKTNSRLK